MTFELSQFRMLALFYSIYFVCITEL